MMFYSWIGIFSFYFSLFYVITICIGSKENTQGYLINIINFCLDLENIVLIIEYLTIPRVFVSSNYPPVYFLIIQSLCFDSVGIQPKMETRFKKYIPKHIS